MSVDERHTGPFTPMPPVSDHEYGSAPVRRSGRADLARRRAGYRSRWWFPLLLLLIATAGFWELMKADQLLADQLIWPTQGAQFVEVGPVPQNPDVTGGRIMIVAGGLNRKSGTGPAAALMPSLTVGHTRVFSLVYGSGINDRDLVDKFDALMNRIQPREVSFFGSSMGGDVVLNLAAHVQENRDQYRQALLAASVAASRAGTPDAAAPAGSLDAGAQLLSPVATDGTAGDAGTGAADTGDAGTGAAGTSAAGTGAAGTGAAGTAASGSGTEGSRAGSGAPPVDPPLIERNDVTGAQAGRLVSVLVMPDSSASAGAGRGAVSSAAADDSSSQGSVPSVTPARLGVIYLDCSPLSPQDVRDEGRTQADVLTSLTEALDTDGGAGVRMTVEVLAQQQQWSYGRMPFVDIRWQELKFKVRQVWRDKIGSPGISTQLVKDQYGVIRRMDIDPVAEALGPGTRIVYFHPVDSDDDRTVRVDRVQSTLSELAQQNGLSVRFVAIPGGHHASAESDGDLYRAAIDAVNGAGGL